MGFIFHAFAGNRKWKRNDILKHYHLAPFRRLRRCYTHIISLMFSNTVMTCKCSFTMLHRNSMT